VIDTHCHLDVDAFDRDRAAALTRATDAGVTGILVPAIRPRTWPTLVELANQHAMLRYAIGIHPQIVPELDPEERAGDLAQRIAEAAHDAVAIGECGVDGGTANRELQHEIFRAHIRAARSLDKPLVVHVLRAHDIVPAILREERARDVGGVLHSYSGGADLVPVYRDLGFAFSFAGPVTYPNARKPIEAARLVPDELLLAETDAPDQTPAGHTGRCEPAYLPAVIAGLAAARATDSATLGALTTANAQRLFRSWS
jgi:TatD DNase family protein